MGKPTSLLSAFLLFWSPFCVPICEGATLHFGLSLSRKGENEKGEFRIYSLDRDSDLKTAATPRPLEVGQPFVELTAVPRAGKSCDFKLGIQIFESDYLRAVRKGETWRTASVSDTIRCPGELRSLEFRFQGKSLLKVLDTEHAISIRSLKIIPLADAKGWRLEWDLLKENGIDYTVEVQVRDPINGQVLYSSLPMPNKTALEVRREWLSIPRDGYPLTLRLQQGLKAAMLEGNWLR